MHLDISYLQRYQNSGQLTIADYAGPSCTVVLVVHHTRAPSQGEKQCLESCPYLICQLGHPDEGPSLIYTKTPYEQTQVSYYVPGTD